MAAITDPLIAAGIATSIGFAAISLFARGEGEMETKMVVRFLFGPLCLAVLILFLAGVCDNFYLVRWLQP